MIHRTYKLFIFTWHKPKQTAELVAITTKTPRSDK